MEADGREELVLVLVQQVAPKAEDGFIFIVLLILLEVLFFKANLALDDLNIDKSGDGTSLR